MLYSLNGSYPTELPDRIRLSDGSTRTKAETFTDEELADAGYVLAPEKPESDSHLRKVDWGGEDWIFVELSQDEKDRLKSEYLDSIREEVNLLLLGNYKMMYESTQEGFDDPNFNADTINFMIEKLENIESTYSEETNSVEWPTLKDVTAG
tara:strand:- start:2422 stop:2874 length:453 start_codon:yes stop_codon:yes gene_type:complete